MQTSSAEGRSAQTGHNAGPLGSLEDTVLLNTSELGGIHIDPERERVRIGAGTKWMHVTERLSDLGLAALHGSSPDVGIVGYSLGGGMGWLARCCAPTRRTTPICSGPCAAGAATSAWLPRSSSTSTPIERLYGGAMLYEAQGRKLLSDIRALGPIMDTFEMVPPFALAELAMDPPDPLPYLIGHQLLEELPTSAIDPLVAAAGPTSQLVMLQFRHMGGAIARPAPDAGARATLPGDLAMFALGLAVDEDSAAAVGSSVETVEEILAPSQVGRYASFVEEPADAREFFDAETWARLREVKAHYDPSDLFRGNHHVPPAGTP